MDGQQEQTFDAKRTRLLGDLDDCYGRIHKIVRDPLWTNGEYRAFVEVIQEFQTIIGKIRVLNEVQQS